MKKSIRKPKAKRTTISLPFDVYKDLKQVSEHYGRTIVGQIGWWSEVELEVIAGK